MISQSTVLITNIPAPYREPIHEKVSKSLNGRYTVIYCKELESNRKWQFDKGDYACLFLNSRVLSYKGRYIHINFDVWSKLNQLDPDVVISCGFNPVMLVAFLWSKLHKKKHICMTDGWLKSESELSIAHKYVRKFVYYFSDAFIGASKHSLDLYKHYNCSENALFQSHLCANNKAFFSSPEYEIRPYDLMFSGQFIDRKMPLFFAEVAKVIRERRGFCKVLLLGSGSLVKKTMLMLKDDGVDAEYPGFVQQRELPAYYKSAKVFLFPTLQEPWGVVANEACAAGTPVITCDNAGAANDLVQDRRNGLILPLNAELWAEAIIELLNNKATYNVMVSNAKKDVEKYNYQNAAQGIVDAVEYVTKS